MTEAKSFTAPTGRGNGSFADARDIRKRLLQKQQNKNTYFKECPVFFID
jgi:hypothetical protein